jgi:hypothetical protein
MTCHPWWTRPAIALCSTMLACGGKGGDGSTSDDGATGPTSSATEPTSDGGPTPSTMTNDTAPDDDGDDDVNPTTQGPSDDTTTESSGPPPADSSSDDANPGICDPAMYDDACLMCVVAPCCQFWMQCQADDGCACIIECHVLGNGSLGSCESQCNSDGELYQAVFFCGQQTCLGTCEWDCC